MHFGTGTVSPPCCCFGGYYTVSTTLKWSFKMAARLPLSVIIKPLSLH